MIRNRLVCAEGKKLVKNPFAAFRNLLTDEFRVVMGLINSQTYEPVYILRFDQRNQTIVIS